MQEQQNNSANILEEGVWSKTKYMVSKLGRLEKGGKIIGRNEQARKAAAQVSDVLNKESAKLLSGLVANVQREFPEFPNMESQEEFLGACELYTSFYDSMAYGTKLNPEDNMFIPAVVANAAIVDLRIVWKNFLDYKLSTVYQTMNEENASNVISGFNHDSETIKTLKSKKLSSALMGLGSSLGAFGWLLKTPFIQGFLSGLFSHTENVAGYVTNSKVLGSIGNGEGITQLLHRLYPNVDISPTAPVSNFQKILKSIGNGNVDAGLQSISGLLKDPSKAKNIKTLIDAGRWPTMGELFDQAADSPTSGRGGSWFETVKDANLSVNIKQQIIKAVTTKALKVGAVGAGLGSFLAPLGVALVAAGITTKLLRSKGLKSSRAQVMNDLLLSWELLPDSDAGSQVMTDLGVVPQEQIKPGDSGETQPQTDTENEFIQTGPDREGDDKEGQPVVAPGTEEPGEGQPIEPGEEGESAGNETNDVLNRLNPEVSKNAEANIQAFGDTITTADKRNPQDIRDEIDYLKYAVKEIPKDVIMPKVKAMQMLIKSNDVVSQLKAVRGFRQLSAYIKNLYVIALKNYSEDTAEILKRDMSYTSAEGLKKKGQQAAADTNNSAQGQQTELPLNEGYATPLFNAAEGKEDILLGTLTQTLPKLIQQLEANKPLTKEQQTYLIQKLSVGTYTQKQGRKDLDPGLVQKIVKEINKWILIRIKDYQAYLKYLENGGQTKKPRTKKPAAQPEAQPVEQEPINEETLNPFFKG